MNITFKAPILAPKTPAIHKSNHAQAQAFQQTDSVRFGEVKKTLERRQEEAKLLVELFRQLNAAEIEILENAKYRGYGNPGREVGYTNQIKIDGKPYDVEIHKHHYPEHEKTYYTFSLQNPETNTQITYFFNNGIYKNSYPTLTYQSPQTEEIKFAVVYHAGSGYYGDEFEAVGGDGSDLKSLAYQFFAGKLMKEYQVFERNSLQLQEERRNPTPLPKLPEKLDI
jgi:hypothetical protein